MIPILWRYTLKSFFKTLILSIATFVLVLLVSRFKEIARFAALSANGLKTGLFAVYQIPFILPMAIPLSAFIASILFAQHLSKSQELNALRASCTSPKKVFTPLWIAALFLSLFTLYISSELTPFCRREAKMLLYRETSANPLLLLQRQKLVTLKDAYLKFNVTKEGKKGRNLILITPNESHKRLSFLSAKKLHLDGEELIGHQVAIISYLGNEKGFDPLIIENQASMSTGAPIISSALKKNRPRLDLGSMSLQMLLFRKETAMIEIFRRLFLSLSAFSLTFVGTVFGLQQGRGRSYRSLVVGIVLALALLLSYFLGKGLKHHLLVASLTYFMPHLFVWICSLVQMRRVEKGICS